MSKKEKAIWVVPYLLWLSSWVAVDLIRQFLGNLKAAIKSIVLSPDIITYKHYDGLTEGPAHVWVWQRGEMVERRGRIVQL